MGCWDGMDWIKSVEILCGWLTGMVICENLWETKSKKFGSHRLAEIQLRISTDNIYILEKVHSRPTTNDFRKAVEMMNTCSALIYV